MKYGGMAMEEKEEELWEVVRRRPGGTIKVLYIANSQQDAVNWAYKKKSLHGTGFLIIPANFVL